MWNLGSCKLPIPNLFEHIGQLLSFLYSEVLCADDLVIALHPSDVVLISLLRLFL